MQRLKGRHAGDAQEIDPLEDLAVAVFERAVKDARGEGLCSAPRTVVTEARQWLQESAPAVAAAWGWERAAAILERTNFEGEDPTMTEFERRDADLRRQMAANKRSFDAWRAKAYPPGYAPGGATVTRIAEPARVDQAAQTVKLREGFEALGLTPGEAATAAAGPYGRVQPQPAPTPAPGDAWDRLAESMGEGPQFAAAMRRGRA